jgi:hypothetical protein
MAEAQMIAAKTNAHRERPMTPSRLSHYLGRRQETGIRQREIITLCGESGTKYWFGAKAEKDLRRLPGIIAIAKLEAGRPVPVYIGQAENVINLICRKNRDNNGVEVCWAKRAKDSYEGPLVYFLRERRQAARSAGKRDLVRKYKPALNPADDYL